MCCHWVAKTIPCKYFLFVIAAYSCRIYSWSKFNCIFMLMTEKFHFKTTWGGGAVGRFQSKWREHLYFARWPLHFCCFAFLLSHIEKRFPTPSFHSCWWLQISNEALWDGLKVKSVDLIERAFGREWTRQLAHGFKWNCIKACPATLSTGSHCELCWKIYFGELGLSIQREKTDWCGDINQAVAWRWLCKWGFRGHGLKQAILKKKVCRGMAEPGAECCCVFATSSAQLLER